MTIKYLIFHIMMMFHIDDALKRILNDVQK